MKLLISAHNDDETLFAAFTILREKPLVVVVFDSYVQPARGIPGTTADARRAETRAACNVLGVECEFIGFRDDQPPSLEALRSQIQSLEAGRIWAPAFEASGHDHHNLVADACKGLPVVDRYLTYTRLHGKSIGPKKVPIERPQWIGLKLKALSCYESQFQEATGCAPHFLRGTEEYYL